MKRYAWIRYFQGLWHPCFINVEIVEGNVEGGVEDTKDIKGPKVDKISRKTFLGEISWYLGLLLASKGVFSISLSRFLSVSVTRL